MKVAKGTGHPDPDGLVEGLETFGFVLTENCASERGAKLRPQRSSGGWAVSGCGSCSDGTEASMKLTGRMRFTRRLRVGRVTCGSR